MAKDRTSGISWSFEPQETVGPKRVELFRLPPKGKFSGTVISHRLIGCGTHHHHGRTIPCTNENCPGCTAGKLPREYFWVIALNDKTGEADLVELTGLGAAPFARAFKEFRTLRGLNFTTIRKTDKANGPLKTTITGRVDSEAKLPTAPDIIPILFRIWEYRPEAEVSAVETDPDHMSEQQHEVYQDGLEPETNTDGTARHERTRRRRSADPVHQRPQEDRSISQEPALDATNEHPIDPAQPLQDGRDALEKLVRSFTDRMAAGSIPSTSPSNWVQPLCERPSNGQLDIH